MATVAPAPGSYPIRLEVAYPERLTPWMPLVKWFLAIPHFIVLAVLTLAVIVVEIIVFFSILFTGKYPRGLFDFVVGYVRWWLRVEAYVALLRDEYPPFRLSDRNAPPHPVTLEVPYPQRLTRWKVLVKWLLAAPHWLILFAFFAAGAQESRVIGVPVAIIIVAFFSILFTGVYPRSLYELYVGIMRWQTRVLGYALLFWRDEYPPLRLAP